MATVENCGRNILGSHIASNTARTQNISVLYCLRPWSVHTVALATHGVMDDITRRELIDYNYERGYEERQKCGFIMNDRIA